jgi:hypothetical protein
VYFRFNEGIVDNQNVNDLDKICLDYSGRVSNGTIVNYDIACRNTGSAIDESFDKVMESKDPIIFSTNPAVQTAIETYSDLGFQHDNTNVSNIYSTFPAWITEEAEKNGFDDLSHLTQIMASYFDALHIQIDNLNKIKNVEYDSY